MESILKKLRQEKDLTQRELAKLLSLSPSTVAMYETGQRKPDSDTLKVLADFFNVTIDYLLGRSDIKNPKIDNKINSDLTEKDEKDIAKELEKMMKQLESQGALMFDGEPLDDESREALRLSLENSMRITKITNKKYTPKKYRKNNKED
ncbi:putative phage repressor [Clostridium aceticum]|uniref:Putative phage repressor n=1 Tax=Clostridium aceticum TaxID=84022 RepID=A0A0D8IC64_9CLOT|nr:helix-turn-helix transcriptional regulator [Clostridium aceticum]AKL94981.1 putative phage repressor [Clostridium aceticum]KJF27890.1 hypothetical protein TZ02_04740 [Clostridium aceticum]